VGIVLKISSMNGHGRVARRAIWRNANTGGSKSNDRFETDNPISAID
jgi:hypothetical protein